MAITTIEIASIQAFDSFPIPSGQTHLYFIAHFDCQSALNIDPRSACKIDPLRGSAARRLSPYPRS